MGGARFADAYSVNGLGTLAGDRPLAFRLHVDTFLLEPILYRSAELLRHWNAIALPHFLQPFDQSVVDAERDCSSDRCHNVSTM